MFFITHNVGNFLVTKYYLNETASSKRLTNYQDSLKNYIEKNHIAIKNVRAISKWVKTQKDVYLMIFKGDEIVYESGYWNDKNSSYPISGIDDEGNSSVLLESQVDESDAYYDQSRFNIKFKDDTYFASILDFSGISWYNLVTYIAWGIFFFFLFLILIIYNHHIIARILHLSKEVSLIEQGNLTQPILHKGNDEISLLALNADNMRSSILTKLQSEKEAWEANSELITSMSHDIRTPLTSLIGYLEILDSKDYHSEEQFEKYIKNCKEKSIQLKDLSDKLFQYFLVFGKENIEMQMESFDVKILLQQLLYEHIFDLKNMGFDVTTKFVEQTCIITADIQYLKRLFNNLFSNIVKYASPNGQVNLIGTVTDNHLLISITNDIRSDSMLVESTHIGLKTCQKIVEQMNGTFETFKDQSHFEVNIIFPIER